MGLEFLPLLLLCPSLVGSGLAQEAIGEESPSAAILSAFGNKEVFVEYSELAVVPLRAPVVRRRYRAWVGDPEYSRVDEYDRDWTLVRTWEWRAKHLMVADWRLHCARAYLINDSFSKHGITLPLTIEALHCRTQPGSNSRQWIRSRADSSPFADWIYTSVDPDSSAKVVLSHDNRTLSEHYAVSENKDSRGTHYSFSAITTAGMIPPFIDLTSDFRFVAEGQDLQVIKVGDALPRFTIMSIDGSERPILVDGINSLVLIYLPADQSADAIASLESRVRSLLPVIEDRKANPIVYGRISSMALLKPDIAERLLIDDLGIVTHTLLLQPGTYLMEVTDGVITGLELLPDSSK